MRDNFSAKTKRILAERVAWRCSKPGCTRITVGPNHESANKSINLGEAAHIFAAAKDGPRYNPNMTSLERKSVENGIWMCRQHARLIDSDFINYSAASLKQWKQIAEENIYQIISEVGRDDFDYPNTLVGLGNEIVFEGVWLSVNEFNWKFRIERFIIGNIEKLRDFSTTITKITNSYVIIETQGDGRLLKQPFRWEFINGKYEISLNVEEKTQKISPMNIGVDLGLGEDGDLLIENGDFKLITGIDLAKQQISNILSLGFGELYYAPTIGSYFSRYFWEFKDNNHYINRMLILEITRLITIPEFIDNKLSGPPLNFINRINDIQVLDSKPINDRIKIRLSLEWGDGKYWEDILNIYIHPK